jgi:hypothetical protein
VVVVVVLVVVVLVVVVVVGFSWMEQMYFVVRPIRFGCFAVAPGSVSGHCLHNRFPGECPGKRCHHHSRFCSADGHEHQRMTTHSVYLLLLAGLASGYCNWFIARYIINSYAAILRRRNRTHRARLLSLIGAVEEESTGGKKLIIGFLHPYWYLLLTSQFPMCFLYYLDI